jgi:hypothetical protein
MVLLLSIASPWTTCSLCHHQNDDDDAPHFHHSKGAFVVVVVVLLVVCTPMQPSCLSVRAEKGSAGLHLGGGGEKEGDDFSSSARLQALQSRLTQQRATAGSLQRTSVIVSGGCSRFLFYHRGRLTVRKLTVIWKGPAFRTL